MARKKSPRQLSLLPFLGNKYTVYVVRNRWCPDVFHIQDKEGYMVPRQPNNFASPQAAAAWAAERGYKVSLDTEGMSHLSKQLSGQ